MENIIKVPTSNYILENIQRIVLSFKICHTKRVMAWYCLGDNFPLEGRNKKGADYEYLSGNYLKEKGMEDRIMWLPIWDKKNDFK